MPRGSEKEVSIAYNLWKYGVRSRPRAAAYRPTGTAMPIATFSAVDSR